MSRGVVLLAWGVLLASGCGAEAQRPAEGQSPAEHRSGSGGTLFFQSVRGQTITRVDLTTGRSKSVSLAELAPGDALFHLVRAKDRLVFYGGSVAYSLDLDLEGPPESLGESLYFVPSAVEGRVWLMLPDPASSETVRDLRGVQETTVDGRVTLAGSGRPPSRGPTIVAAVTDGLLFQQADELRLWNPRTGRVTARIPGPFPAGTHGNLVASCQLGCPRLHITDVQTGDETAIAADGFRFEESYDGAFSPDGTLLAVPAVLGSGGHLEAHRHAVALVDLRARTARVIPGSDLAADYPAFAWAPSGDRLFFHAGGGRLMAYRLSSAQAVALPFSAGADVIDIAAG